MHNEKGDNLLAGFIKLVPWSNACGRKDRVPQSPVIIEMDIFNAGTLLTRNGVITYTLNS